MKYTHAMALIHGCSRPNSYGGKNGEFGEVGGCASNFSSCCWNLEPMSHRRLWDRVPALLVVLKGQNFEQFYAYCRRDGGGHSKTQVGASMAKGLVCLVSQLRRPQVRRR